MREIPKNSHLNSNALRSGLNSVFRPQSLKFKSLTTTNQNLRSNLSRGWRAPTVHRRNYIEILKRSLQPIKFYNAAAQSLNLTHLAFELAVSRELLNSLAAAANILKTLAATDKF